ncbi:unnamed protein product [Candidula unifasciata]|uniref:Uncharacterized protein n=1 Tax=Candidula unifasciata TaxID=100452 RepID=A0A8S3YKJ6_9EUPU|nr:unnamed protein product [Candidula unifasciata]
MNNRKGNRSRTREHRKSKRQRSHNRHSSSEHSHGAEANSGPPARVSRKYPTSDPSNSRRGTSHDLYRQPASSTSSWDVSSHRRNLHQRSSSTTHETSDQRGHKPSASSSSASVASSCQPSTNAQQPVPQVSDIPGYYYDEASKLYFKMQSYNLSTVAPFVTRDKIVSQQKENQRVVDVQNFTKQNLPASTASSSLPGTTHRHKSHLVSVLQEVQCGQFAMENFRTYMFRHMCSRVEPDVTWENSLPLQPSFRLGQIENMEVSENRDKIACVSSLKSSYSQVIQLLTVGEHHTSYPEGHRSVLRVTVPSLSFGPIHKRIKTMCWAPIQDRHGQATILYTTVCPIGCLASIAYLSNIDAENDEQILFELNLGKNIIWSAAWNSHRHQLTIGAERRCGLIDVATRKQWTFNTLDSDPLAQLFCLANPYIYNGTRKGHILLHDVRAPDKGRYNVMMKQTPGVGCLRLLKDENYLLASDFSGKICTWDQRMRKIVMEYSGLMNSHWQLAFSVDETETVLTSMTWLLAKGVQQA